MTLGFALFGAASVFLTAAIAIIIYVESNRQYQRDLTANPPQPPRSSSCGMCCESLGHSETLILDCSHFFHKSCLIALIENEVKYKRSCPICRKYISEAFIKNNLM